MASRKNLKQNIKYICGELFADCVALRMCEQAENDVLDTIMQDIITMNVEYVSRISHTEKGNVKGYYRKLKEEFSKKTSEISERILGA